MRRLVDVLGKVDILCTHMINDKIDMWRENDITEKSYTSSFLTKTSEE